MSTVIRPLLFPTFYKPKVKQEFKLGVIPHFMDVGSPTLEQLRRDDRVKIINVVHSRLELLPISNRKYLRFVDDICRCEKVVSSSLHGLIVADAYGIPSQWMTISDRATLDGFKYLDYFASVHRSDDEPMRLTDNPSLDTVVRRFRADAAEFDVDRLLESCPFRS